MGNLPVDKVKDVLITKTAIRLLKPETVVEKVISFQFKDAVKAMREYSEVEISGFGKFYISDAKVKKRIDSYEKGVIRYKRELDSSPPEERRLFIEGKIKDLEELIIYLKGKL